jgi:A/G-specific adenine glycosylase
VTSAATAPTRVLLAAFRERVYTYYREAGRDFAWRQTDDPFHILVSELMLQQTQVARVAGHYPEFLAAFPTATHLAAAPLADVLRSWTGLGYNRRALHLHRTAAILVDRHAGDVPHTRRALLALPGVGEATAGAVLAFAFGQPSVFIETNIRRAFLAGFFADAGALGIRVHDAALLPLVAATRDRRQPREWYYALMDYGAGLARGGVNVNRASAQYTRQSPFQGSTRQLRGAVIRQLTQVAAATCSELAAACVLIHRGAIGERIRAVVAELVREGLLAATGASTYGDESAFCIANSVAAARR